MTNPTYKQTAANIKNDPSAYKRMGSGAWTGYTWSSAVTGPTGPTGPTGTPGPIGRLYVQDLENYRFHPDSEINSMAKEFSKENYGRESWKVNGEVYAEFQYKLRELEKKMGILIQQPSEEMLANSAALRDAYEKYKFIERLALEK